MKTKITKVIPDKENTYRIEAYIDGVRFESVVVLTKENIINKFGLTKTDCYRIEL